LPAGGTFVPGETVFFRAVLAGYSMSKDKKVKLSYTVEPIDQEKAPLVAPVSKLIEETLSEQDKEWRPVIRHSFLMPPFVFSGTYLVRLSVKDEISGAEAKTEARFEIRGHDPDPSQTVAIRNFHFFRAETDAAPLKIAAFRPGDPLWARFDVTGYKFGDGNEIHVEYTIAIADAHGNILFRQQDPVVEKSQSFYPKRYVPCVLNLTIQPNTTPAEYHLKVSVKDLNADHSVEGTYAFRVE